MLAPSQEENTNPNEARFVSHSDVSLAYTLVGHTDQADTLKRPLPPIQWQQGPATRQAANRS